MFNKWSYTIRRTSNSMYSLETPAGAAVQLTSQLLKQSRWEKPVVKGFPETMKPGARNNTVVNSQPP